MNHPISSSCPICHAPIPENAPQGLCPKCVLMGAAAVPRPTNSPTGKTPPPTVEELAPHFPELEILELIGVGGMSAVYKARQLKLDRFVALKILSSDLTADPAFLERFNREARMLARLSHANIVSVFDTGTAGPFAYLIMEYMDGVNLRQAMRAGRFTPAETLTLVENICAALKFAHEKGILHRDIKPENILIDSQGQVKIVDFGIAKLVGEGEHGLMTLTSHGAVLGTPHYMAPEQLESPGSVDERADIYSLGVVFYELLTGELPMGRFAPPSKKSAVDARIDEIVLRTLEKEREARFQSAGEVGTQVAAVASSPQAAAPVPAAAAPADSGPARFSLVGAILTGLSLVAAATALYCTDSSVQPNSNDRQTLGVIGAILTAVLAFVGFILGCRALGEIHKSGGRKDGLGSSVFAVVVWPVLVLGVVGSFFLSSARPASAGGGPAGPMTVVLLLGGAQLLSLLVLVRGLRRWAGGVVTTDGDRRFPGLTGSIVTAIGLAVVAVAGIQVSTRYLDGKDADIEGYIKIEPDNISWYRGAPEIILPLRIHDIYRAEFRLALYDGEQNLQKYVPIGTWEPSQRRKEIRVGEAEICLLKIGTTPPEGDGTNRGMTVLIAGNGKSGTLTADTDFAEWKFDPREELGGSSSFPPPTAGSYSRIAAWREETIDGKTKRTGVLRLEIQLIER